jgi:hypothetical protein
MSWNRYVAPFSCGLWLAVVVAVCALTVCLALTNCGYGRNQGLTFSATIFYIHACFCQQGQKAFLLYELFLQSFMIFLFSSSSVLAIFFSSNLNLLLSFISSYNSCFSMTLFVFIKHNAFIYIPIPLYLYHVSAEIHYRMLTMNNLSLGSCK